MKKYRIITLLICLVSVLSVFCACDVVTVQSESEPQAELRQTETTPVSECSVTLVYNNGEEDASFNVQNGCAFPAPEEPQKENYIFVGWYADEELTQKYDFSQAADGDLTLYAGYVLDGVSVTNQISTQTIKGLVTVYNKCYNTGFMGMETSSILSQGSGFCFEISEEKDGYCYYILTNCHVALQNSLYSHQTLTVEDYKGNTYTAAIYQGTGKTAAIAAEYDLACLYFKAASSDVIALDIAQDPAVGDDVISLGAPQGQNNCITYGNAITYATVELSGSSENLSNVTFEVVGHDCYINEGSSGGPLLNARLQVVGVNYAGNEKNNSSENRSFAIPASKVYEFLNLYVYNL